MKTNQNSVIVFAVLTAEVPDTTGEILLVKGADISALQTGTAPINTEHINPEDLKHNESNAQGGFSTIIGRVITAKKIYSAKDCENEDELKAWEELQVPMIVGLLEFFDGPAAHPNAQAAASLIRIAHLNNTPHLIGFSVEGSILKRENNYLVETEIKRIAATLKPANKASVIRSVLKADTVAAMESKSDHDNSAPSTIYKAEASLDQYKLHSTFVPQSLKTLHVISAKESGTEQPKTASKKVLTLAAALQDLIQQLKLSKNALAVGNTNVAPGALAGGAALTKEGFNLRTSKKPKDTNKSKALKPSNKLPDPLIQNEGESTANIDNSTPTQPITSWLLVNKKPKIKNYHKWLKKTEKAYYDLVNAYNTLFPQTPLQPLTDTWPSILIKGQLKELLLSPKLQDLSAIESLFKDSTAAQSSSNLSQKALFDKPHVILSVENPHYNISPNTTYVHTRQMIRHLRSMGENALPMIGKYNNIENSILVLEPKNVPYLHKMAEQMGQESYIYSDGKRHELRYVNGPKRHQKVEALTGPNISFSMPSNDYFSVLKHPITKQKLYFTYDFDWNNLKPYQPPTTSLNKTEALDLTPDIYQVLMSYRNQHALPIDQYIDYHKQIAEFEPKAMQTEIESILESKKLPLIQASLLHQIAYREDNHLYLIKPYFIITLPPPYSSLSASKIPIGFSALTYKNICNNINIDTHEPIYGAIYKDLPIIFTKWPTNTQTQPQFITVAQLLLDKSHTNINTIFIQYIQLFLHIAILDYLLGNINRTNNTVLIDKAHDNQPIFLDHEYALQYKVFNQCIGPAFINLLSTGFYGNIMKVLQKEMQPETILDHFMEVRKWWNLHKNNILYTFSQNLDIVKDTALQKELAQNFISRFKHLDYIFYNQESVLQFIKSMFQFNTNQDVMVMEVS